MDTSNKREPASKRQFRSVQEKLRIVEEASEPTTLDVLAQDRDRPRLPLLQEDGDRRAGAEQDDAHQQGRPDEPQDEIRSRHGHAIPPGVHPTSRSERMHRGEYGGGFTAENSKITETGFFFIVMQSSANNP